MPNYKFHIFCCTNERPESALKESCGKSGAHDLHAYFKSRVKDLGISDIRVNKSGCLDQCEQGPVIVIYPEGRWYKIQSREDVDAIIETHLLAGENIQRLNLDMK